MDDPTSTTYIVDGMSCGHRVGSVTDGLTALPGVTGVDVDLASGRVTVSSRQPLAHEAVRSAVAEAGYEVTS